MTSAEQSLPIKDQGSRIMDLMDCGSRIMGQRSKSKYQGSNQGSRIMDQGAWIKYQGSRIMDQGSWTLDLGPGMNGQPGRDTDLRSRPSESTIKDLSFDIGFTWIQSSNKHVGPCFVMNGHFCRDPDLISRLPGNYYNSSPISFYRF